jgi:hypothetical protein
MGVPPAALRGPRGGSPWTPYIASRMSVLTDVLFQTIPRHYNIARFPMGPIFLYPIPIWLICHICLIRHI